MIKEGCLDKVDEVYGMHNIPNFDEGDIRIIPGPIMANSTRLTIEVKGKGGHGSTPHLIVDPIACGNAILTSLHSIKARNIDSRENAIFSICHVQAGTTNNVFPDTVLIRGTIRTYTEEALRVIKTRTREICEGMGNAFECEVDVTIKELYPSVVNH